VEVNTGRGWEEGGRVSHSWVMPTSDDVRPREETISVAEGRSDTMRSLRELMMAEAALGGGPRRYSCGDAESSKRAG